jgi:hypothetical protein
MAADRELAQKCAFDARTLLNDMQGNGHIDELKLLKSMQLLVDAVQALAERTGKQFFVTRPPR